MKGRPEEYSQKFKDRENFSDWFTNVFWFQYKWVCFAVVVIVAVLGFLMVDAIRQTNYDTSVVIASRQSISEEALTEMDQLFTSVVPDINGNGKVEIEYIVLFMGNDDLGMSNQERIWLCFTDSEYALYLMDESCSDLYCEPSLEYFEHVADYGFEPDPTNTDRVPLEGNPLLERAGLDGLYASLLDHSTVTGDEDDIATTQAALAMLNALLDAK